MRLPIIATAIATLFTAGSFAQMKVTQGNEVEYKFIKKPTQSNFYVNNKTTFIIKQTNGVNDQFDLFTVGEDAKLSQPQPIQIELGTFKNMNTINSFQQVGNKIYMLVENCNKSDEQNTLSMRTVSENSNFGTPKTIGSIPYTRMIDPGTWLAYVTPDKQHIALVAVYPKEKQQPQKGKYYFLDASLNVLSSGDISIGDEKKKNYSFQMLASDKGDIYLINTEFDKSYRFAVVYRKSPEEKTFTEFACLLPENLKNVDFTAGVAPAGNLIVAGYTQAKATMRIGDIREQANGIWVYNSDNPASLVTLPFEKTIPAMRATAINFNGGTAYITGEQITEKKEGMTQGSSGFMGGTSFEENFSYTYEDLVITGYDMTAGTKFDIPLSRKFTARNTTYDLTPGVGVKNGKFTLLYNDDLRKYIDKLDYTIKVPVVISVTKEGLMETPEHFEKELNVRSGGYTTLSYLTQVNDQYVVTLQYNGYTLKAAVLK